MHVPAVLFEELQANLHGNGAFSVTMSMLCHSLPPQVACLAWPEQLPDSCVYACVHVHSELSGMLAHKSSPLYHPKEALANALGLAVGLAGQQGGVSRPHTARGMISTSHAAQGLILPYKSPGRAAHLLAVLNVNLCRVELAPLVEDSGGGGEGIKPLLAAQQVRICVLALLCCQAADQDHSMQCCNPEAFEF